MSSVDLFDLTGKVAVVTGAASGIGLGLAQRFAADGMRVVMSDIEEPALEREAAALAETGAEVLAVVTDTSLRDSVDSLAEQTLDHFGAVHLLCNNAGVGSVGTIEECAHEEWSRVMRVNIDGPFLVTQAALPLLLASAHGAIVNIGSVAGLVGGS